jgi:hypothetical protein
MDRRALERLLVLLQNAGARRPSQRNQLVPLELLREILSFLDVVDAVKLRFLSKHFHNAICSPVLWKALVAARIHASVFENNMPCFDERLWKSVGTSLHWLEFRNLSKLEIVMDSSGLESMLTRIRSQCRIEELIISGSLGTRDAQAITTHLPELKSLTLSLDYLNRKIGPQVLFTSLVQLSKLAQLQTLNVISTHNFPGHMLVRTCCLFAGKNMNIAFSRYLTQAQLKIFDRCFGKFFQSFRTSVCHPESVNSETDVELALEYVITFVLNDTNLTLFAPDLVAHFRQMRNEYLPEITRFQDIFLYVARQWT